MTADNDLIWRDDALDCFMGLDRTGDIMDAIAAIPAAQPPTLAQALAVPEIAALVKSADEVCSFLHLSVGTGRTLPALDDATRKLNMALSALTTAPVDGEKK